MGLIDAMVYKLWSWMSTHAASYAAHIADASAHHTKYTDAEVDAIVATHTAIPGAHHARYTDAEVDAIVLTHKNIASAHHTKYTDAEVDAIVLTHKNIANAHHTKYTDAEAIAAVLAEDDYVKNIGDTMTGSLTVSATQPKLIFDQPATINPYNCGIFYFQRSRTGGLLSGDYLGFERFYGSKTDNTLGYGVSLVIEAVGDATATYVPCKLKYGIMQTDGTVWFITFTPSKQLNINNGILRDPKNHAASALSGTKKLVEINIGGTAYYFEVYPTKA